jgi:hypothetical protein
MFDGIDEGAVEIVSADSELQKFPIINSSFEFVPGAGMNISGVYKYANA